MDNYKYVIIKWDTPYFPKNFPKSYCVGKDVDILVLKEDFDAVCKICDTFSDKFAKRTIEKDGNCRIRYEDCDNLHYQFDISWKTESFDENNVRSFISGRTRHGSFWVCSLNDEIQVRKKEVEMFPHKHHHEIWIDQNITP